MRLQLVVALLFAWPAAARADSPDGAEASFRLYSDNDHTTVESWAAQLEKTVGRVQVSAAFAVDTISSASVDLVSAASPHGFTDRRVLGRLGLSGEVRPNLRLSGGVLAADEHDYGSESISGGAELDVLEHRITLGARAGLELDRVYRSDDPAFERHLTVGSGALSATLVLDRRTLVDLIDELAVADGFQASPYRYVRVYEPGGDAAAMMVPENDPTLRVRNAAVVRLRRALGDRIFVHGDYRFYADSWGVVSHTLGAQGYVTALGERLRLGARVRGYLQDHAAFYRRRYETFPGIPETRTADKELAQMHSLLFGANAAAVWRHVRSLDELRVELYLERLDLTYVDFELLSGRAAWITGGTLALAF